MAFGLSVFPMSRYPCSRHIAIHYCGCVSSRNPNLLGVDWRCHNWRRNNSWRCNDNWRWSNCAPNYATHNPTDEAGPEVRTPTTPRAVVMVMNRTVMHHRWRSMSSTKSSMWSPMRSCEHAAHAHCDSNYDCQFLGHFSTSVCFVCSFGIYKCLVSH